MLLGRSKSCYRPSMKFLKSRASPLQGWLRKSTDGRIPLQRCRHSLGTAGAYRTARAGGRGGSTPGPARAGCACGSRCRRFGARCYLFPGVGCSPADVPLPAGRGPGCESTRGRVGLVPSTTKVSLERMCWWGWGGSRSSCSPLGERWSGFDALSPPVSIRGRRGKCTAAMLLLLPKNTLRWEPAAVTPVSSGVWVDSEGYLQLKLKLNKLEVSNSFIWLI